MIGHGLLGDGLFLDGGAQCVAEFLTGKHCLIRHVQRQIRQCLAWYKVMPYSFVCHHDFRLPMNTDTGLALQRAAAIARGQAPLARLVGVRPQTFQQWANGQRPIPPRRAYRIECATGIDRRWFRLNDWKEHWPELVAAPIRPLPPAPADDDSNSALAPRAA
ncbi:MULTISPECIES: YdaS family helix-turn-helix protein [unclassified Burkholderia]|uniref:transcriptional regulator n=1 Tax=unclassified Burkholderia TaxID=2613784 RepID=UPI000F578136|nr:hypothetical protein DIE10_06065 [Burkholderia sp. Bp9011]RQR97002.1 hypothetical protein DIE09_06255 [Burkholderia sp. Bp9010]RQS80708.1 hypothetical protein DID97_05735 [Burkholderia sp. Bp8977]